MRYRKLSATGDYTWGANQKNFYIDEPAAVGQAVRTRLLLFQGEWFLDTAEGTALLTGIIGIHPKTLVDQSVQDRVTGTQGFLAMTKYESQISPDRNFSASLLIDTIYGSLTTPVNFKVPPVGFKTLDTESGDFLETESGEIITI